MRRTVWIVGLTLGLAACGPSEPAATQTQSEAPAEAVTAPQDVQIPASYIGTWASADTACGHERWLIQQKSLNTPIDEVCDFNAVHASDRGGVDIDATCHLNGGDTREQSIHLSYAESAKALLIEAQPLADVGLVRCGA